MEKGTDYRIIKLEKGPLQRFKNQNLILKRFGETGLQVYKAITGKRTADELRRDLGVEQALFGEIIDFMRDAGMIELQGVKARAEETGVETPEEIQPAPEEEKRGRALEELPPEEEAAGEEKPPLEEQPRKKRKVPAEEEITPEFPSEDISLMEKEEAAPAKEEEAPQEEEEKKEEAPEEFGEIKPIEFGEEEKPRKKKPAPEEETKQAEEEAPPEEEIKPVEEGGAPEEKEAPPGEEITPEEKPEETISYEEEKRPEAEEEEAPGLSPVEKIISDKYGDIGLRVYTLIDGQRTAEEIMKDTGLTETKLVEILDFMDEQGIIKLDYPKGQAPPSGGAGPAATEEKKEAGFVPMIEGEHAEETGPVPSPLEIPLRAPVDIVKSVQMKAKVMLKYGDRGSRIFSQVDGKNDLIDLAMNLGIPLYTVSDVLKFMMENGMVIMKPVPRADVRKKYGDDGYSVYKRYGKEGLMFYELIGKSLTIRQMADQITTDKSKVIDMFIFIHKVLGIELPIDKDVLAKQLGI